MKILSGLKLEEFERMMEELGATKFRAKQIHNWIYAKSVSTIDEMTNLSKDFREELKINFLDSLQDDYNKQIFIEYKKF